MALTCGFFNSENGDRKYNAEQMSAIFDGIIADGVFTTIGDHMAVSAGTGMQVLVGTGKAWFDHTWNVNDAAYPLAIAASDVTLSRIDAIVLETNHSDSVRLNKLRVVQGTVASSPVKPTLTNSEKVHQHPLAWVTVAPGVTQIAASAIENAVGTSACPFVTGIIATTAIDDLFNQWNGEFDEWFDNLKAQLSDNVVANLQKQIDALRDKEAKDVADINARLELIMKNKALVRVTVKTPGGSPLSGILVTGIEKTPDGNDAVYTDAKGLAEGYANEGSVSLSISGYYDIADKTETVSVYKGYIYEYDWTIAIKNFLSTQSSMNKKFSTNVRRVDVTCVGGGAGGYNGDYWQGGGDGGTIVVRENCNFTPDTTHSLIVGSGGARQAEGGATSFLNVTALGGLSRSSRSDSPRPGSAAGGNGNSQPGSASTIQGYSSFTEMTTYGGGGGGGAYITYSSDNSVNYGAAGGSPGGGAGGDAYRDRQGTGGNAYYATDGRNGTKAGGGGGGGGASRYKGSEYSYKYGGRGANGLVAIRMHLKIAS